MCVRRANKNAGNLIFVVQFLINVINCVNNKMLEHDWLLTALKDLCLDWLFQVQTIRFDLSDYKCL